MRTLPWLALLGALLAAPAPASACGGFFCSRSPMNQAGENILYSVESDGTLSVHVQILYSGTADRFAWILPLPQVPISIGVGTDALFQQLGQATAPRFDLSSRVDGTCRTEPSCPGLYGAYDSERTAGAGGPPVAAADAAAAPSVTVYLREAVGPYDATVLGSTSTDELFTWLATNGYDIPDSSRPIVGEYVAARHVFVAIRLITGADTREIQPLVLRYASGQPCVPIRLTAIATVPDMPITTYFLGQGFAAPTNYSVVEPTYDEPRLWQGSYAYDGCWSSYGYGGYRGGAPAGPGLDPTGSSYYPTYVSNEVDAAGGRAWVTEFAGSTPSLFLELPSVDDLATVTSPSDYLRAVRDRGFQGDSQLLGMLVHYLPPPASSADNPASYYNCLWTSYDPTSCGYTGGFDPGALTDAIRRQIVEPRREASLMLARQPRTSRLFTTMSAEEMTLDPEFRLDSGLPEVSNVHTATLVTECGPEYFCWTAPQHLELPSGTSQHWRDGVSYLGTDEAFCRDLSTGAFSPWSSFETLQTTSRLRSIQPGGGARCSASFPGSRGAAGAALGLALLALAVARRRSR